MARSCQVFQARMKTHTYTHTQDLQTLNIYAIRKHQQQRLNMTINKLQLQQHCLTCRKKY